MFIQVARIIILLFWVLLYSCSERLDLNPYGAIAIDDFYKNEKDAEQAVTAAYKMFTELGDGGRGGYDPFGDILGPDVQAHPDLVHYYQIQQNIVEPSQGLLHAVYIRCYKAINLVNYALENIADIDMDSDLKSQYLGELYFIRGFWMFRLGYFFGTAPVIDKVLKIDELNVDNSNYSYRFLEDKDVNRFQILESDLFEQAKKDFIKALECNLADRNTGSKMGRADKGAVKAYLAKIYMYEHNWEEAKKHLADVLGYGYELLPDYNNLFNGTSDNSIESVFEVQYTALNEKDTDNFGTVLNAPNGEGYVAGGGWGWTRPTPDILSEYEDGDARMVASIFRKNIDDFFGQIFEDKVNGTGLGIRKWTIGPPPNNFGVTVDVSSWRTSANYTLMRYAEVMLMYAEVMNELGDQFEAVKYINLIRERANSSTDPNTININNIENIPLLGDNMEYEDVFWAIVHEKRIEFAFEGKFGWDLRRWGIASKYLNSSDRWQNQNEVDYFNFIEGVNEIFPIPQTEIDRSGGLLKQNIGY